MLNRTLLEDHLTQLARSGATPVAGQSVTLGESRGAARSSGYRGSLAFGRQDDAGMATQRHNSAGPRTHCLGRIGNARSRVIAALVALGVAAGLAVAAPTSALANAPASALSCGTATIADNNWSFWLQQSLYYCVYGNGAGVYSIGKPVISGGPTARGWFAGYQYDAGQDTVNELCYSAYGRGRGYCDVTVTNIVFEDNIYGTFDSHYGEWTMVRVYYNGYAICHNGLDSTPKQCS